MKLKEYLIQNKTRGICIKSKFLDDNDYKQFVDVNLGWDLYAYLSVEVLDCVIDSTDNNVDNDVYYDLRYDDVYNKSDVTNVYITFPVVRGTKEVTLEVNTHFRHGGKPERLQIEKEVKKIVDLDFISWTDKYECTFFLKSEPTKKQLNKLVSDVHIIYNVKQTSEKLRFNK